MTKFSWRRESSLKTLGSQKMDSRSFFSAHRLAYSSHASVMILKFWCHENEPGSLYFGPLRKWSIRFWLRTMLRSPITIWPHGAYRKLESQQEQDGGGVLGKTMEIFLLQTCFVIENFGIQADLHKQTLVGQLQKYPNTFLLVFFVSPQIVQNVFVWHFF